MGADAGCIRRSDIGYIMGADIGSIRGSDIGCIGTVDAAFLVSIILPLGRRGWLLCGGL